MSCAHLQSALCSNGVEPDARLYGTLMSVAGAAGDVGLAFSLLDEMEAEGLRPSAVRHEFLHLLSSPITTLLSSLDRAARSTFLLYCWAVSGEL